MPFRLGRVPRDGQDGHDGRKTVDRVGRRAGQCLAKRGRGELARMGRDLQVQTSGPCMSDRGVRDMSRVQAPQSHHALARVPGSGELAGLGQGNGCPRRGSSPLPRPAYGSGVRLAGRPPPTCLACRFGGTSAFPGSPHGRQGGGRRLRLNSWSARWSLPRPGRLRCGGTAPPFTKADGSASPKGGGWTAPLVPLGHEPGTPYRRMAGLPAGRRRTRRAGPDGPKGADSP